MGIRDDYRSDSRSPNCDVRGFTNGDWYCSCNMPGEHHSAQATRGCCEHIQCRKLNKAVPLVRGLRALLERLGNCPNGEPTAVLAVRKHRACRAWSSDCPKCVEGGAAIGRASCRGTAR